MFGGNSNWREPTRLPANVMLIHGLRRFARRYGDGLRPEVPTGSGRTMTLSEAAAELTRRGTSVLQPGGGRRPARGDAPPFCDGPA